MATSEIINREMLALHQQLATAEAEGIREQLGHAALLRMKELKKVRASMVKAGLDVTEVDADMDLLRGTKEQKGLFFVLDVSDDAAQQKKKTEEATGEQRSIEDGRDYSTHGLNSEQAREYVSDIVADEGIPLAAKIIRLNALEDGEREREGGPRETHLKVIRAARQPLTKKVKKMEVVK